MATLAIGFISVTPAEAQRRSGFFAQLFGTGHNTRTAPAVSSSQRRINRAVQTALNYFEFDAGSVDGIFGRKSRAAAKAFQGFMGYEETGQLTREESRVLLTAYNEISNKNEALALKVSLGLAAPQDLLRAFANGEIVAVDTTETPPPEGTASMRSLCVNIGASGPIDLLKAQFCNLRQLAIEQSDFLIETSLNGQAVAPVFGECRQFTSEMQPNIARIASEDGETLSLEMELWIRRSGVPAKKLEGLAETCLGIAYKQDDTDAALAALLLLSGLKDAIYMEQMGYHLALGLTDMPENLPLAQSWIEAAAAAQPEGDVSLTAQSADTRIAILADVLGILSAKE